MSEMPDETMIRAAFAPARVLEPTDQEIAVALARADLQRERRRSRSGSVEWRRLALPAVTALAFFVSAYAAVPPLRAAIDDVADTFSGYLAGDESQAPGRDLRPGESAAHGFPPHSEPRVIAEADGYQLQFVRAHDGMLDFDLGETGVGFAFAIDELRDHAVYLLGPGAMANADESGHVPLFGVVAPQVTAIELTYATGPSLRIDGIDDGFVLLAEPVRDPQEVIGYDAAGREVERVSLHQEDGVNIDWSQYGPASPRIPIECQPGSAGKNPPPGCPG